MRNTNLAVKSVSDRDNDRIQHETYLMNANKLGDCRFCTNLPIHMLNIPSYQRGEKGKVRKIATEWDGNRCDALVISYRDGKFWIVDGRQRAAAAKLVGLDILPCTIMTGLTEEDEVFLYTHQKSNDTRMGVVDAMMADAKVHHEPATTIFRVCKQNGVEVNSGYRGREGILSCMSVILTIFKRSGEDGLDWVFKTVRALKWDYAKNGYSSNVLASLGNVYCNHANYAKDAMRRISEGCLPAPGDAPNTPNSVKARALMEHPGCGPVIALTSLFESFL